MGAHLFGRFRVKAFDTFMEFFESGYEHRKQLGVLDSKILRDPNDPNVLLAWYVFADVSTAQTYVKMIRSDAFLQSTPVTEGGILPEEMEMWVGKEV